MNLSPFLSKNFTEISQEWSLYPGMEYTPFWEYPLLALLPTINQFMSEHYLLPVCVVLIYHFVIEYLQQYMFQRRPIELRTELFYWNASLAVFSIYGTIRVLPELIWTIRNRGFGESMCDNNYVDDPRVHLWIHLFSLSKVVELGDTVFIVLRKQRLLTLHYVHHMLTLLYCWYSMVSLPANSRWFCSMNFLVHSFMYSYYAVMASGIRVGPSLAQCLTTVQILQMIIGTYANVRALVLGSEQCKVSFSMAFSGFVMYLIFLVLFVEFFIEKYLHAKKKKMEKSKKH